MFVGHYSAAFVAKRMEPRLPLWLLLLAVQLVDVFWALFVLAGIERASLDPALPSNPLVLSHMPYTHGLVPTVFWAVLTGLLVAWWLGRGKARPIALGVVLAIAVASHWLLDLLVHRPDLPLWGNSYKVGLGLWNYPAAAFALELMVLALAILYLLGSTVVPQARRNRIWGLVIVLALLQIATSFGAAPPSITAMVLSALVVYAGVAAAGWWVER